MVNIKTAERRPLEPEQRAIVIGASSGIGAALVRRLALQGYTVAALARREQELQTLADSVNANFEEDSPSRVLVYGHDVNDTEAVADLFRDIVRDLGGLDLIVYVAGIQPKVEANEYNFEKDAAMPNTLFLTARAFTIAGGTSEIVRNQIAERILGMPRDPLIS